MLATRLRKVLTAAVVLLLIAFASPVLTPGTASADSTDSSGYFTYTSDGTSVTATGCTSLCVEASVSIPSTIDGLPVTSVTSGGFSAKHIVQLTIPSSVTSFNDIWQGGYNITEIVFAPGSKITRLRDFLFANNGNLRSIVMPDHLKEIGQYTFYNAGLDSVTIPGTVATIEAQSFLENRFTAVTIPASVTSLSSSAFDGNVTKTFAPPAVSSVTYDLNGGSMPGGSSLPTQADATQNTSFTVGNGFEPVKAGYLFGGWSDGSASYADGSSYPMGGSPVTLSANWVTVTWTYEISNGEVNVSGCTPSCPDAALTIPSTIEGLPVTSVAKNANFSGAEGHVAQLTIPSSVSNFGGVWQANVNVSRIVFAPNSKVTTINGFQFANNGRLRSIVLPDHLRVISGYAFYNAGLDSITIPGTVTTIDGDSFPENRFRSVTIPASVTSLASNAFSGNVTKTFADPVVSSVTYNLDGGSMPGGASAPTQADTTENTTFTVGNGTDPVKTGYGFGGWVDYWGTIFANGASYTMVGIPTTLTAVWTAPKYSVTYALGGGTGTLPTQSALASDATFQVASGAELSYEGHSFLGWSDGSTAYKAGDSYTVRSSNVTLTALWSVNQAPIPDNVLPRGVDNTMIGKPTNVTLSGQTDATLTLGSEGTNASVTVPAGALPAGTTVSVYPVLSTAGLADTFPSGHKFVVSMVVTWRAPDGSVPIAGVPVTMTISNPAIKKGDKVYQYFNGVLTFVGKATKAGTITFTFTEDPVFTVSSPPVSDGGDGGSGGTGGDGSGDPVGGVTDVVDATETASGLTLPHTGSNVNTPLGIAFVLVTLGGAMVLGTRRKKASPVRNNENEFIS